MDLFADYQQEFQNLSSSLQEKISNIIKFTGEERKSQIRSAQEELSQLHSILEQLSLNVINIQKSDRDFARQKIKEFEVEFSRLQSDFRNASFSNSIMNERDELFGELDYFDGEDLSKESFFESKNKLLKASGKLELSERIAIETEEVGNRTLEDLRKQRETLENSRNGVNF
eukprot:Anaeramoba_ignava/a248148_15.p1 GENE.a248148_15~~a248148_15.p1  ORF type:complete len:193 (-),score=66.35 a248148_15:110-625(-)